MPRITRKASGGIYSSEQRFLNGAYIVTYGEGAVNCKLDHSKFIGKDGVFNHDLIPDIFYFWSPSEVIGKNISTISTSIEGYAVRMQDGEWQEFRGVSSVDVENVIGYDEIKFLYKIERPGKPTLVSNSIKLKGPRSSERHVDHPLNKVYVDMSKAKKGRFNKKNTAHVKLDPKYRYKRFYPSLSAPANPYISVGYEVIKGSHSSKLSKEVSMSINRKPRQNHVTSGGIGYDLAYEVQLTKPMPVNTINRGYYSSSLKPVQSMILLGKNPEDLYWTPLTRAITDTHNHSVDYFYNKNKYKGLLFISDPNKKVNSDSLNMNIGEIKDNFDGDFVADKVIVKRNLGKFEIDLNKTVIRNKALPLYFPEYWESILMANEKSQPLRNDPVPCDLEFYNTIAITHGKISAYVSSGESGKMRLYDTTREEAVLVDEIEFNSADNDKLITYALNKASLYAGCDKYRIELDDNLLINYIALFSYSEDFYVRSFESMRDQYVNSKAELSKGDDGLYRQKISRNELKSMTKLNFEEVIK